jgi:hypothetical protein
MTAPGKSCILNLLPMINLHFKNVWFEFEKHWLLRSPMTPRHIFLEI